MKRFHLLFLLSVGFLLGTQCAQATTLIVGTCRKATTHYSTISAAVAAAAAGDIVDVCAGTYAEQVVISTPLTLVGIANGTDGRVIVAFPAGGLAMTVTSVNGGAIVAPQMLVTTGPVNITNITVDGSLNNLKGSGEDLAGIMYEGGASGTVSGVTAREQMGCGGCGVGIWAENGSGPSESVTIQNSQVHDADAVGMFLASSVSPSTLTATVKGNQVINTPTGIFSGFLAGTISSNTIADNASFGVLTNGTSAPVVSNTIVAIHGAASGTGIKVNGNGTFKSNLIVDENGLSSSFFGIDLSGASGATVESNRITNAHIGIEFGCKTGNTVSGNIVIDATTGLDAVPTGLSVPGTVQNVDTLRTGGC